jgi:hypothetical protein
VIPATEHRLNCMVFSVRVPVLSVNRYSTWCKAISEVNRDYTTVNMTSKCFRTS